MEWEELKNLLYNSIIHRDGNKLICENEEKAKEIMLAIHKLAREGLILRWNTDFNIEKRIIYAN